MFTKILEILFSLSTLLNNKFPTTLSQKLENYLGEIYNLSYNKTHSEI